MKRNPLNASKAEMAAEKPKSGAIARRATWKHSARCRAKNAMNMELETINKLYLELSQIATAETEKERLYKDALLRIRDWSKWPSNIESQEIRMLAAETLKRAQLL